MVKLSDLDLSRRLTGKEKRAFLARQGRLNGPFGASAADATRAFNDLVEQHTGLVLRDSFSLLSEPIDEDLVSDRRAPKRPLRPSATRISSSKGAALRFYLTALALGQVGTAPGGRAKLPDLEIAEFSGKTGWTDLVATGAEVFGKGRNQAAVRDKKGRSVRTALDTLAEAQLVQLPGTPGLRGRHSGFTLLHEAGRQLAGDSRPYHLPKNDDTDFFAMPPGFLTNGWLQVLEDSEITLLLMVACGKGSLYDGGGDKIDLDAGEVAIPAEVRLRSYGIHRDPYSTARKTLDWFGLLGVREVGRWDDGRAEEDYQRLHRMMLLESGFERDALETVRQTIDDQLERASA